jgi:acyl-coenzyme A synthetase/AMP-(fatty) acid ligase
MTAIWQHGAVVVPVNDRLPDVAVESLLERTGVAAVVSGRTVERRSGSTVHDAGAAFVLFTSGTTGEPKAIVHHHDAYLGIIDRVLGPLSASRDTSKRPSPNLIPVPMALNAGIYNALFGLRAGSPLVLMDRFATADFAALVRRHEIRSTVLPPASIAMLNDDPEIGDLGPLRYVRSITAPLSPFQARRFTERFGAFVLNGYGQAELGEVIGWTAADAKSHPDKIGAVGKPHPGVEVRIDAPDDRGIGELLVKTAGALPAGVVATLGDRLDADGFVRTGDLARLDDGWVWIEGRVGDLINRGGNKVFPDEVEEVLASVPGIREAAVVGMADDRLGEVPVAFVVGDVPDAELEAACRTHLAPYKVPVRYERIDRLPRNDVGKILRRELQ